jgi:hypothetical protein
MPARPLPPGIWQRDGNGSLRDVVVRNVAIETQFATPLDFWGSGEPIVVTSFPSEATAARVGLQGIRNVTFENVTARSQGGVLLSTRPAAPSDAWQPGFPGGGSIDGLTLRNVSITIAAGLGNVTRPGSHDFRPVDPSFADPALFAGGSYGSVQAPVDGLFVDGATAVVLDGVRVAFDPGTSPPPATWSRQCLIVTSTPTVEGVNTLQCFNRSVAVDGRARGKL